MSKDLTNHDKDDFPDPLEIELDYTQKAELETSYFALRNDLALSIRVGEDLRSTMDEAGEMDAAELAGSRLITRCVLIEEGLSQNPAEIELTMKAVQSADVGTFQELKKMGAQEEDGPRDNVIAQAENAIDAAQLLHDEAWQEVLDELGEEAEMLRQSLEA